MEATIIKKDGKATMDKDFNFMLSLLRNGEYTLTIKRKTKPRTLDQNALMWMWDVPCVSSPVKHTGVQRKEWKQYMTCTARSS